MFNMIKPWTLLTLLPLITSSLAVPATGTLTKKQSGPSINVIFFSDNNCTTTVPSTDYTRQVFGSSPCHLDPTETYNSLLIDEIDDQFIGTNSALQVGTTSADVCGDFTDSLKFSIATRDTVGECQFIGIPMGMGKPLSGGNEYVLTSLEG